MTVLLWQTVSVIKIHANLLKTNSKCTAFPFKRCVHSRTNVLGKLSTIHIFPSNRNGKCSKTSNTSCLPKKAKTNRTDPDQTASKEAV